MIGTGIRKRFVPNTPSNPSAAIRSQEQVTVTPVANGGTGARTAVEARSNLGVAGIDEVAILDEANVFTNTLNTFEQIHANSSIATDGSVFIEEGEIRATSLTAARVLTLPDRAGEFALTTDAPASHTHAWSDITGTIYPKLAYTAQTGTYAVLTTDCVVDCTSGSWTATLPTAVNVAGKLYILKNSGAGTLTLATTGGQTIDGAAPGTIAAGNSLSLISTGANWIIV